MKEFNDEYLKRVFKTKLQDFEAQPDHLTWEKLDNKIPAPANSGTFLSKWFGLIALTLLIPSGTLLYKHQSNAYELSEPNYETSQAIESNYKVNEAEFIAETDVKDTVKLIAESNTAEHIPTIIAHKIPASVESNIAQNNNTRLPIETTGYNSLFEAEDFMRTIQFDINTRERIDEVEEESDKDNNSTKRTFYIKLTPYYSAGIFKPDLYDDYYLRNFSTASSVRNRIGLGLEYGNISKLSKTTEIEYGLGYRFFSKDFSYEYYQFTSESISTVAKNEVRGLAHLFSAGFTLKFHQTPIMPLNKQLLLGLRYENIFSQGNSLFKTHYGADMITLGAGIEYALSEKLLIRPRFDYSLPFQKQIRLFGVNQMNFGIELMITN
ncbi:MAG TPA: hypothetical protein PKC24_06990 [Cyclobacteriaceae bacterium]|nr:hypothetical protein [Cyclobacteriaceae bacterium]